MSFTQQTGPGGIAPPNVDPNTQGGYHPDASRMGTGTSQYGGNALGSGQVQGQSTYNNSQSAAQASGYAPSQAPRQTSMGQGGYGNGMMGSQTAPRAGMMATNRPHMIPAVQTAMPQRPISIGSAAPQNATGHVSQFTRGTQGMAQGVMQAAPQQFNQANAGRADTLSAAQTGVYAGRPAASAVGPQQQVQFDPNDPSNAALAGYMNG